MIAHFAAKLLFALCLLSAISGVVIRKSCDYQLKENCYTVLPFCKTWTYEEDSANKGLYVFKCEVCEAGFVPLPNGVSKLTLLEGEDIPDAYALNQDSIFLCKREEIEDVFCGHSVCQKELPFCRRYKVTNIRNGTVSIKGNKLVGDFECLECEPLYEPYPAMPVVKNVTLSPTQPKRLCSRRMETRVCAHDCQFEFPGCSKYETSGLDRKVISGLEVESAIFKCLQAAPGFEIAMRTPPSSTDYNVVKYIAIKQYETESIPCDDVVCKHVLPNCNSWSAINYDEKSSEYICTACREGYQKRPPVKSFDYITHWGTKKNIQVCQIAPASSAKCDDQCQEELPGCLHYSVWNISPFKEDVQTAVYKCEECKKGYRKLEDLEPIIVQNSWEVLNKAKVRCFPDPTPNPTPVTQELKDVLPRCLKYTATYDPQNGYEFLNYDCTECEEGFEPNPLEDIMSWFIRDERPVCRPKPIEDVNGAPCDANCKETFPGCDQIRVLSDFNGRRAYHCTACAPGWWQIPYETPLKGLLSNPISSLITGRKIRLCSPEPNIVYTNREECVPGANFVDSAACSTFKNCRTVLSVSNFETAESYQVCGECGEGFTPKNTRPHPYDADQTLCEPVKAFKLTPLVAMEKIETA